MIKIFSANALARTVGGVTLAQAVLDGPILKNRKMKYWEIVADKLSALAVVGLL
jgi:hypothetical protein